MAFGIGAPGLSPESHPGETRFKTLAEYRDAIRAVVQQGVVDIMLMSASTNELLTIEERLFEHSSITPAARANDTSDIFVMRGGRYLTEPARPFRSATLDHIQCGRSTCDASERLLGADLGLYSVTFVNRLAEDLDTLERFKQFRVEAEQKSFRYFLEVFDPNIADAVSAEESASFVNDMIARSLAGVTKAGRPLFLKMVYHGPKAMEELHRYDPNLVIGVLGGSAGTTYDAFKLLSEAQKYGARAALFGRKINGAEHQLAFIQFLRYIADGAISAEEAVRAYHAVLERLQIRPIRSLEEDSTLKTSVMSYGGTKTVSLPSPESASTSSAKDSGDRERTGSRGPRKTSSVSAPTKDGPTGNVARCGGKGDCHCGCDVASGPPKFATMTGDERLAYHRQRIAKMLGDERTYPSR